MAVLLVPLLNPPPRDQPTSSAAPSSHQGTSPLHQRHHRFGTRKPEVPDSCQRIYAPRGNRTPTEKAKRLWRQQVQGEEKDRGSRRPLRLPPRFGGDGTLTSLSFRAEQSFARCCAIAPPLCPFFICFAISSQGMGYPRLFKAV